MKAHIIKDCCNRHHIVLEKKFYKDICRQAEIGPYWWIKLDDVYETINRPNFSEQYRYDICYAIMNCYLHYLKDHTISIEEEIRLLKFWWIYREYVEGLKETSLDHGVIIQLMAKIVTSRIIPSKTLSNKEMNVITTKYCQMKASEWRDIKDFNTLSEWIYQLRPDYDALLQEAECEAYGKEA